MKKWAFLILAAFWGGAAFAQNDFNVKEEIKESLLRFFEYLSSINDVVTPVNTAYLAGEYKGEHYFIFNGKETDFEEFLVSYGKKDLGKHLVNHTLNVSLKNINKTSNNNNDHRWTVQGRLTREPATKEDYGIKDEDVTIVAQWNGKDREVSILELTFSSPLKIVRPITETEYKFEVNPNKTSLDVPHKGGEWKIVLDSWRRDVKSYPGIEDRTTYGDWYLTPFTYSAPGYANAKAQENPQVLSGRLSSNSSITNKRSFSVKLTQTASKKVIYKTIVQSKKSIFYFPHWEYHQIDAVYGLEKYFGLSYMYTFDYSRFSVGAMAAVNGDFFRGWNYSVVDRKQSATISYLANATINGYDMTSEVIMPQKHNYSELLDPNDDAKHYTSRFLFLAQGGYNVAQWLRLDLGLGTAMARDLHFMENACALVTYHYEKTSSHLPDIEDVHSYQSLYKDFYFKEKPKWGFAIRPAVVLHIPLASDYDSSLAVGTGYTFVAGLKDASSLDFSIGIRWKIY